MPLSIYKHVSLEEETLRTTVLMWWLGA